MHTGYKQFMFYAYIVETCISTTLYIHIVDCSHSLPLGPTRPNKTITVPAHHLPAASAPCSAPLCMRHCHTFMVRVCTKRTRWCAPIDASLRHLNIRPGSSNLRPPRITRRPSDGAKCAIPAAHEPPPPHVAMFGGGTGRKRSLGSS